MLDKRISLKKPLFALMALVALDVRETQAQRFPINSLRIGEREMITSSGRLSKRRA